MERGTLKSSNVNRLQIKVTRSNDSIAKRIFEEQADKLLTRARRLPRLRKFRATNQKLEFVRQTPFSLDQIKSEITLDRHGPLDQAERLSDQLSAEKLPPSPPSPQQTPLAEQPPSTAKIFTSAVHHCEHSFDPRGAIVSSDPLPHHQQHSQQHKHRHTSQHLHQHQQHQQELSPLTLGHSTQQQVQQELHPTNNREHKQQQTQSQQPCGHPGESEPLHQTSSPFAVGSSRPELTNREPDPRLYSYEDEFEYDQLSTDPSIDQAMLGSLHAGPVARVHALPTSSTSSVDTSHPSLRVKAMPAKYSISMASGKSDSLAVRRMPSNEDIGIVWTDKGRPADTVLARRMRRLALHEAGKTVSTPSHPVTGIEGRKFINARMKVITGQDHQPANQLKMDRYTTTGWVTTSTGGTSTGTTRSVDDSLKVKPMLSKEDIGQAYRAGKGARIESASLDLGHYSHMSKKLSVGQVRSKKAWAAHCTRYRPASPGSTLNDHEVNFFRLVNYPQEEVDKRSDEAQHFRAQISNLSGCHRRVRGIRSPTKFKHRIVPGEGMEPEAMKSNYTIVGSQTDHDYQDTSHRPHPTCHLADTKMQDYVNDRLSQTSRPFNLKMYNCRVTFEFHN